MTLFAISTADRNFRIFAVEICRLSAYRAETIFTFLEILIFQIILNQADQIINYATNISCQLSGLRLDSVDGRHTVGGDLSKHDRDKGWHLSLLKIEYSDQPAIPFRFVKMKHIFLHCNF